MLSSEYRFPLFDNILYGSMSPFSPSNSCEAFLLEEEPRVRVGAATDNGIYNLSFRKPLNQKCLFYFNRLMNETVLYCNGVLEELSGLSDPDVRAFWQLALLERHLKTLLIKTGEVLREHNFTTADFMMPAPVTDTEKLSNSYIFHLLKVCLAKAYLEVQSILEPTSAKHVDETYLYTAFTCETPPVRTWLTRKKISDAAKQQPQPKRVEKKTKIVPETKSPAVTGKIYTLLDLTERKLGSPRTLRRKLATGELKGFKNGNIWLIEESELDRYIADLKVKTKTNNK